MSDGGYKDMQDSLLEYKISLKITQTSGVSVKMCDPLVKYEHINTHTQSQSPHRLFMEVK